MTCGRKCIENECKQQLKKKKMATETRRLESLPKTTKDKKYFKRKGAATKEEELKNISVWTSGQWRSNQRGDKWRTLYRYWKEIGDVKNHIKNNKREELN